MSWHYPCQHWTAPEQALSAPISIANHRNFVGALTLITCSSSSQLILKWTNMHTLSRSAATTRFNPIDRGCSNQSTQGNVLCCQVLPFVSSDPVLISSASWNISSVAPSCYDSQNTPTQKDKMISLSVTTYQDFGLTVHSILISSPEVGSVSTSISSSFPASMKIWPTHVVLSQV